MTAYAKQVRACGLSPREAADLHGVHVSLVTSWIAGVATPPKKAFVALSALRTQIDAAAEAAVKALNLLPRDIDLEIGFPADDHEAQTLGFPCIGAWRAMFAIVETQLDRPVRLVPRGSTPATAAAIDAHAF